MTDKATPPESSVVLPESISVHDFAEAIGQKVTIVMTALMKNGVMATINDQIDRDTATIVASELGVTVEAAPEPGATSKTALKRQTRTTGEPRPPVVAVMGHVDHGKTSLLDAIRGSDTTTGEAGGITQHISASHIEHKGRPITLLDTPGHEAFASLREHGAALTDVAVLVVAADDGVKPQTKEAAEFARRAGVPIVVAINKVDKTDADLNRVKQQLADIGLNPEEWGGDTVVVEVSAKTKAGLTDLLDMVLLVADIDELKAETAVPAEGIVIESHMDTGEGPVATLLIEQGQLRPQQYVVAGDTYAKVRRLSDESGQTTDVAGPSRAVTVTGFKAVPNFGDRFIVVPSEKLARTSSQAAEQRSTIKRVTVGKTLSSADEVLASLDASRSQQVLPLIIKADVRGSMESLVRNLESLGNDEVSVKVLSSGVGNITESDIALAKSSQAVVVGFQVDISAAVKRAAARDGVSVKLYRVIYELLDEVRVLLESMLTPEIIEDKIGSLTIKGVFRTARHQIICGGEVTEGKAVPGVLVRLSRGAKEILGEAEVTSVQRSQQAVKEVVAGEMCGLELKTAAKVQLAEGDRVDFFRREERRRSLAPSAA